MNARTDILAYYYINVFVFAFLCVLLFLFVFLFMYNLKMLNYGKRILIVFNEVELTKLQHDHLYQQCIQHEIHGKMFS